MPFLNGLHAVVAKHVNRHKYRLHLDFPLPCLVINGPAKSTAVLTKALTDGFKRLVGNGAIICSACFAFLLLQAAHSLSQSIISSRAAIIQYLVDNKDSTWFVPELWFPFS